MSASAPRGRPRGGGWVVPGQGGKGKWRGQEFPLASKVGTGKSALCPGNATNLGWPRWGAHAQGHPETKTSKGTGKALEPATCCFLLPGRLRTPGWRPSPALLRGESHRCQPEQAESCDKYPPRPAASDPGAALRTASRTRVAQKGDIGQQGREEGRHTQGKNQSRGPGQMPEGCRGASGRAWKKKWV